MRVLSLLVIAVLGLITSCDFVEDIEAKAQRINRYEVVALNLAKENRQLRRQISDLEYDLQKLKTDNQYLSMRLSKAKPSEASTRSIASISAPKMQFHDDMVKFDVYKWTPQQLLSVADTSYAQKDFKKAAQYYYSFIFHYPEHEKITDNVLFRAGVSAYESGSYYGMATDMLSKLIKTYPTSPHYRQAKLWNSLARLKEGDKDFFFETVEEFRKKYRNTNEWTIISRHYYDIEQKYKKN